MRATRSSRRRRSSSATSSGRRLLKVSRAAYYAARGGQPSDRDQEDAELAAQIAAVHEESKCRYGAPRVHAQLRRRGRRHSRKRIARLMRQAGIRGPGGEAVEEDHDPRPDGLVDNRAVQAVTTVVA